MRDTDYAFCVTRIRANETKLLSADFINKLVDAADYDGAISLLVGAGWIETGSEDENFIRMQSKRLWTLLEESVPDKKVLDCLCILNDYYNIKTAIKCIISGENADLFYIEPTTLDLERLSDSIDSRSFDVFKNPSMKSVAKNAFEIACTTNNGHIAETIVDVAALEALLDISKTSKYKAFSKICSFTVDASNIRTAIRCANIGKDADFVKSAISSCSRINKEKLIAATAADKEQLKAYVSSCEYAEGAELYYSNPALYDKWFDEKILKIATQSAFSAFGFDPVCAYFYKKTNEIKTVKMILSAKKAGIPSDMLRERVKVAYV